jgi:hypothetical protein
LLAVRNGWAEYALEWRPGAQFGYSFGPKLYLTVRNLRAQETVYVLEPGLQLSPAQGHQAEPLLLCQRLQVRTPGGMAHTAAGVCMGLQMLHPAHPSPVPYTVAGPAPESLRQLACTLAERNLAGPSAQATLWALTDGLPIALIESPDRAETELLRRYAALATRRPYRPTPPDAFFTYPKNVTGTFRYYTPAPASLSLLVLGEAGQRVLAVFEDKPHQPGEYAERIELLREELPNGSYRLQLVHQGKVLREVAFRCG